MDQDLHALQKNKRILEMKIQDLQQEITQYKQNQEKQQKQLKDYQFITESQEKKIKEQDLLIQQYKNQLEKQEQQNLQIKEEACMSDAKKKSIKEYEEYLKLLLKKIQWQIAGQSMTEVSKSMISQYFQGSIQISGDVEYNNVYEIQEEGKDSLYQEIFEAFYIIGVDKDKPDQKNSILYSKYKKKYENQKYNDELNELKSIESIIEKFASPHGCDPQLICSDDLDEDLTKIICDSKVRFENFYMFNIRGDDLQLINPKNIKILQQFNHSRQLYGYCFKVEDFLFMKNDQNNDILWSFKKVLCFVTYFPIKSLFHKLFEQILYTIQLVRLQILSEEKKQWINKKGIQENLNIYSQIDGIKIIKIIENVLSELISKCSQYSIVNYGQVIKINLADELSNLIFDQKLQAYFKSTPILYTVPKEKDLYFETKKLETHMVLTLFTFEQFFQIFVEILKEGKIIFCCQNQHILTDVTSFFSSIIYPFQWFHQVIYNLPSDSLVLLEFNQPMIFGFNMSYQRLKFEKNIISANKQYKILYVDILEKKNRIDIHEGRIEQKLTSSPNWENDKKYLERQFKTSGVLSFTPNNDQEQKAIDFLKNMQRIIKTNLIDNVIPEIEDDFIDKKTKKPIELFIFTRIKQKISKQIADEKDQYFVKNYVLSSAYFTHYYRHLYAVKK